MNIPDHLLPAPWLWASHFGALLVLALALRLGYRRGAFASLKAGWRLNLLLGACVSLMLLWSIQTGVKPGLNFHVLGATALTLMFGWPLALFALALITIGTTLAGLGGWGALSINFLLMGALPVAVSHGIFRLVDGKLPNHFMVYVFLCAFFGAALAMAATGAGVTLLMALSGTYSLDYLTSQYLPYFILMGWSEAILTGMALSLMVVYRPAWVATFDDARYLQNH